jgi:hypothetical protein
MALHSVRGSAAARDRQRSRWISTQRSRDSEECDEDSLLIRLQVGALFTEHFLSSLMIAAGFHRCLQALRSTLSRLLCFESILLTPASTAFHRSVKQLAKCWKTSTSRLGNAGECPPFYILHIVLSNCMQCVECRHVS